MWFTAYLAITISSAFPFSLHELVASRAHKSQMKILMHYFLVFWDKLGLNFSSIASSLYSLIPIIGASELDISLFEMISTVQCNTCKRCDDLPKSCKN